MSKPRWQWEHPEIDFGDPTVTAPHRAAGCELTAPCRVAPAAAVRNDPGMENTNERPDARVVAETWLAEQCFPVTGWHPGAARLPGGRHPS